MYKLPKNNDKPITIEKLTRLVKEKGTAFVLKDLAAPDGKLLFECWRGHFWFSLPRTIYDKGWCPTCMDTKRKKHNREMHLVAAFRGGKCLSESYINIFDPLEWKCSEGHSWFARPSDVKNNHSWCPVCAGSEKHTIEDMRQLAKKKGGKCLSRKYTDNKTRLKWQCANGHTWLARSDGIIVGDWCAECAGVKKGTIEQMQQLASSKGGQCLSKQYIDTITKLKWKCSHGHVWYTTPNIVKGGHWCPECAGVKKKNISDMRRLAAEKVTSQ